jgi:hypothetical protein
VVSAQAWVTFWGHQRAFLCKTAKAEFRKSRNWAQRILYWPSQAVAATQSLRRRRAGKSVTSTKSALILDNVPSDILLTINGLKRPLPHDRTELCAATFRT